MATIGLPHTRTQTYRRAPAITDIIMILINDSSPIDAFVVVIGLKVDKIVPVKIINK